MGSQGFAGGVRIRRRSPRLRLRPCRDCNWEQQKTEGFPRVTAGLSADLPQMRAAPGALVAGRCAARVLQVPSAPLLKNYELCGLRATRRTGCGEHPRPRLTLRGSCCWDMSVLSYREAHTAHRRLRRRTDAARDQDCRSADSAKTEISLSLLCAQLGDITCPAHMRVIGREGLVLLRFS